MEQQETGSLDLFRGIWNWISCTADNVIGFLKRSPRRVDAVQVVSRNGSMEDLSLQLNHYWNRTLDSFEDHFNTNMSYSPNTFGSDEPAEFSLHGIFVPNNIEDWREFASAIPDSAYPRYKMIAPKKSKILALDLDETLVHSSSNSSSECDYFVEVFVDRSSCLYYVFKRPFVDQFLDAVSNDSSRHLIDNSSLD